MDDLGAERVNLAHCIREAPGGVVQMWPVVCAWSTEQFFMWWLDWSQGLDYTLERVLWGTLQMLEHPTWWE